MSTIVVDLLYGDSGKGSIVEFLCRENVDLVIRYNGGFQAAHNVLYRGKYHTFSQFGSGTLNGVPTYLLEHVIIEPRAMLKEAKALSSRISDPLKMLTINPDCLVSTVYHRKLNRYRDNIHEHGSCGVGIGTTREMWSKTGDGLRASDLLDYKTLKKKLSWIRQWCQDQIPYDEFHTSIDSDFVDELTSLHISAKSIQINDLDPRDKEIVFEGSQGAALDQTYGDIPHTTYSNTLPTHAVDFCNEYNIAYDTIGVIRSYETRHGNGPMSYPIPLDIEDRNILAGSWAGDFRTGWLDLDKVRKYARLCNVTCMAINHMDQFERSSIKVLLNKNLIQVSEKELISYINDISTVSILGYGPARKIFADSN